MSRGKVAAGGGIGVLVIALIVMAMGGDPSALLSQDGVNQGSQDTSTPYQASPEEEELRKLVSKTLKSTEEVWQREFPAQLGKQYREPKLVMFTGQVDSACGAAEAGMGPFYCGEDQNVYIDLSFYQTLRERFRSAGDFAQAYVIAHEVGHHVQRQLGVLDKVHARRGSISEEQYNQLSVRLELQADFLAGVWAHHAQDRVGLDEQDIREALEAASAIGDDNIQRQSQGYVQPESFTHGSGEQRVRWFMRGYESGKIADGDTFNARKL